MEQFIEFAFNVVIWFCVRQSFIIVRGLFKRYKGETIYVKAVPKRPLPDSNGIDRREK